MSVIVPPDYPQTLTTNSKRSLHNSGENGPPQKKRKQLLEDDDSSEEQIVDSHAEKGLVGQEIRDSLKEDDFRVNEEFAKRFEYNKRREELTRLQEKLGRPASTVHVGDQTRVLEAHTNDLSDSSSDEDEDDNGVLALGALDEQVQSTLEAIRNRDPRVYDASVKFYTDPEEDNPESNANEAKKEKPMYISDYHRKNLLKGDTGLEDDSGKPLTYQEEQDDLKTSIVKEMHEVVVGPSGEDGNVDSTEDEFLVKKTSLVPTESVSIDLPRKQTSLDVESADKDPEAYLSSFMSTKGWLSNENSRSQPFESDDEEEDNRAEAFEEAYNFRFEDPKASNEKLMSHARDTAARYSVRKNESNPRKKKRDLERSRKDTEKQIRLEEKARLRKLKVLELEEKVKIIKEAAGLENKNLPEDGWSELLDDAWDDEKWELAMGKHFGDDYYNGQNSNDDINGQIARAGKMKKPKWGTEIEINDLVADFDVERADLYRTYNLTIEDVETEAKEIKKEHPKKTLESEQDPRKLERLERRSIEQMVDGRLAVNESLAKSGKKHAGYFRYRETSPLSHGLTINDILMADDSQLNQFAGLKKLASFRDPDKKRKDKKHLGKKQRLRQWRKETFGDENGPTKTIAEVLAGQDEIIDKSHRRSREDRRRRRASNRHNSGKNESKTL